MGHHLNRSATNTPGSTTLLTVTDVVPVPVVANTVCTVIQITEDASVANWPTTAFVIRRPLAGSTAIQKTIGALYEFTAAPGVAWQPGKTVGYVQLPIGTPASTTFSQDEQA